MLQKSSCRLATPKEFRRMGAGFTLWTVGWSGTRGINLEFYRIHINLQQVGAAVGWSTYVYATE